MSSGHAVARQYISEENVCRVPFNDRQHGGVKRKNDMKTQFGEAKNVWEKIHVFF
jgi:hypothetical protein